jgi:hypothetical protein
MFMNMETGTFVHEQAEGIGLEAETSLTSFRLSFSFSFHLSSLSFLHS